MDKIYLIGCILIALSVPYLSAASVLEQIAVQALFLLIGVVGFVTFTE